MRPLAELGFPIIVALLALLLSVIGMLAKAQGPDTSAQIPIAFEGVQDDDDDAGASISTGGGYETFLSYLNNLAPDDINCYSDDFVYVTQSESQPSAEEFPIEIGPTTQWNPAISGNLVVWSDEDQGIYGHNLDTEETSLFTNATIGYGIITLALYDETIVWIERNINPPGEYNIYAYDIAAYAKTLLHTTNWPTTHIDIWGEMVIWESSAGLKDYIFGYDLGTQTLSTIKAFGDCGGCPTARPSIWGNYISFRGHDGGIYLLNFQSGTEKQIVLPWDCPGGIQVNNGLSDISGNIVVWHDRRQCTTGDIYGYDLTTENVFPISINGAEQGSPRISNNL